MTETMNMPEIKPRHIAMIMDGNGRWAQQRGLLRMEGHRQGAVTARTVTELCCAWGIEQLTLYCLSSENWKRPKLEIDFLMDQLRYYMVEERPVLMKNNIRLRVIGLRDQIPDDSLAAMDETIALTSNNTGMTLCLAINYGSRREITDAVRKIVSDVKNGILDEEKIDETLFSSYLYTKGMPDPDLLIRTGGEKRLSNYLLWQMSYAEIWVTEKFWPDFDETLLRDAITEFAGRERRFGGLKNETIPKME